MQKILKMDVIGEKMDKNKVFQHIQFLRLMPADILYLTAKNRQAIDSDLDRLLGEIPYENVGIGALNYALLYLKPYRSVYYYRTRQSTFLQHLCRWLIKPLETIEIHGNIGNGLAVYHTYSVIHPFSAGSNLTVGHGVTIGKGKPLSDCKDIFNPIIGNDVHIYTGAIVFGGIRIGNNVEIGAGAVVNRDVPDNCTVVGNPMRIISKKKV